MCGCKSIKIDVSWGFPCKPAPRLWSEEVDERVCKHDSRWREHLSVCWWKERRWSTEGRLFFPNHPHLPFVSGWLTLSCIMHLALEVKITFEIGRCVRTRSQVPELRLVSCRNIRSQVFLLYPWNCTKLFDTSAFAVAMHALCVSVNNVTLFFYVNIISVKIGLWGSPHPAFRDVGFCKTFCG